MSEQKMPALPEPDELTTDDHDFPETYYGVYSRELVERTQREAYEACDRQWRERLEPLRVAVEELKFCTNRQMDAYGDERDADFGVTAAEQEVIATARTLLEQTR